MKTLHIVWWSIFACLWIAKADQGNEVSLLMTKLSSKYEYKFVCVATGNATSSALVINTPLLNPNKGENPDCPESKYLNNVRKTLPLFTDKEYSGDTFFWIETSSLAFPLEALTDERWEDLPATETNGNYFLRKSVEIPNAGDHTISFSVRTDKNAQIGLCQNDYFENSRCYWILLKGVFKNNSESRIRKCTGGITKESYPADTECYKARAMGEYDVVSTFHWQTFTVRGLEKDSIYYLHLFKNGESRPFLSFVDNQTIVRPKYFNVRHLDSYTNGNRNYQKAIWKIHNYPLSYTTLANKAIENWFNWQNQELYILMYISMCKKCSLHIKITDYTNNNYAYGEVIVQPDSEEAVIPGFLHWQKFYHKFTVEQTSNYYRIHITTLSQGNDPYWIIDKIKLLPTVPDVKYQSVTIKTKRIDEFQINGNISCQLLSPPHSVYFERPLSNETCDSNCLNTCKNVSEEIKCERTMTCNQGKCKCPVFYEGKFCDTYQSPFPTISVRDADDKHTQIKIELSLKNRTNYIYEIEYKMESKEDWMSFKKLNSFDFEKEIVLENLTPANKYKIRTSLVVNEQKYSSEPTDAETYCYDPVFGNITEEDKTESTVTLNVVFEKNASICDFNSYQLKYQYADTQLFQVCYGWLGTCKVYSIPLFESVTFFLEKGSSTVRNKTYQTSEGAPTKVSNFQLINATSSSIYFSWKEPDHLRGLLKNYVVHYENYQHLGCPHVNSEDFKKANTLETKETKISIENLSPYSYYTFSVAALTGAQGDYSSISYETKATDISDEIIQDITYDVFSRYIRLKIKMDCTTIKGPVYIRYDGIGNQIVKALNTSTFTEIISPLEPYTAYTIVATPGRQNHFNEINAKLVSFTTAPAAPPAVTQLQAYSKDATRISLRWMAPNPPNGELELYNITYYNTYTGYFVHKTCVPQPCELFEGLTCSEIEGSFYEYNLYTIKVYAKNKNVDQFGQPQSIKVTPKIEASTEPRNIKENWNEEISQLSVNWDHPDLMNGPIKHFVIELKITDYDGQRYSNVSKETKNVDKYMKTYHTEITKVLRSATYDIAISAFNGMKGRTGFKHNVIIPPLKPQFDNPAANVSIKEKNNSSIIILLPDITVENQSRNCSLYVVISDNSGTSQTKGNVGSSEKILEEAQVLDKDSWVAAKLKVPVNSRDFTVGDGTSNDGFINQPVDIENKRYEIIIVLENEYRSVSAYSRYSVGFTSDEVKAPLPPESSSGWIIVICIIVVLVPVVLWIAYRWKSNKGLQLDFKTIAIPGLRRQNRTIDTSSSTIPLTVTNESSTNGVKVLKPRKSPPPSKSSSASSTPQSNIKRQHVNSASRRINISDFKQYVQEAFKTNELQKQHEMFPRGQTRPIAYGSLSQNKSKNRYANLVAYDATRVILSKLPNDPFSDYINANYIDGYQAKNAYIATQGPKPKTVNDFWRMVWQENCKYIIMLTNLEEKNKKKCEQYWPNINEFATYGEITIHQEKTEVHADYISRFFKVSQSDKGTRTVEQLHFTSWPDHGVPLYPKSLVPFLKRIVEMPLNPPIIVHCSAGVGRTGTIILCDICLRMAAEENALDALHYLKEIREQRSNLVDNIDQYKLVHLVLVESLLTKPTSFPCNEDFEQTINKLIKDGTVKTQMDTIDANSWQDIAMRSKASFKKTAENRPKNRFQNILPDSAGRVFISRWPLRDEHSDYINAVTVDGFRVPDQFIVTQQPLPNTVVDFWRLVQEQKASVIVSLNNILSDDDTTLEFWPAEDDKLAPVPYLKIKHVETVRTHFFDLITVKMTEKSPDVDKQTVRTMIKILQVNQWEPGNVLPSGEVDDLISLWRETQKCFSGNGPIIVTCHDGSTACGLFVALSFVIEKIKLEQECDVCLAVRTIRRNRQQLVRSQEQFKFLYKTAVSFVDSFEHYSNFQPTVNNN